MLAERPNASRAGLVRYADYAVELSLDRTVEGGGPHMDFAR